MAGSITLQAARNISVDNITSGSIFGGEADIANINITSVNGAINTGEINATSQSDNIGGNIRLSANGNITTGKVSAYGRGQSNPQGGQGGIINFTSTNGSINTGEFYQNTLSYGGPFIVSFAPEKGGSITLIAERDNITTGNFNLRAIQNGGSIALRSGGTINIGAINTTGASAGGNITIQASTGITTPTTGTAIAGTSSNGNGSNVTLSTASGDINIGDVLVSGIRGGNLNFTNSNGNITTGQLLTS